MSDEDYVNSDEAAAILEAIDQTMGRLRAAVDEKDFRRLSGIQGKMVRAHGKVGAREDLDNELASWLAVELMGTAGFDSGDQEPTPAEWAEFQAKSRAETQDIRTEIVRYQEVYGR